MSGQGVQKPNKGEAPEHQEITDCDPDKRTRTLSRKALENAIQERQRELHSLHKSLKDVMQSAEQLNEALDYHDVLRDLVDKSGEFKIKLEELRSLYPQDKEKQIGDQEATVASESLTLDQAYLLIDKIKSRQSNKLLETRSRLSSLAPKQWIESIDTRIYHEQRS